MFLPQTLRGHTNPSRHDPLKIPFPSSHSPNPRSAAFPFVGSKAPHFFLRLVAYVSIGIGLALPAMQAQPAAARGTVTGRVQDAVTGKYLANARISVEGTSLQNFTDELGQYSIGNLPSGTITLQVYYTGMKSQSVSVNVQPSGTTETDFSLNRTHSPEESAVVKMADFRVSAIKEQSAAALAINEQRFAGTVKNVVSTDAYGEVFLQNIGEFLKMLPGIEPTYSNMNAEGLMVRGFPAEYTSIALDGIALATPNTSNTRTTSLWTLSLNNASRIEVTKLPSPDQPATNLSGSINMISKSAFELSKPALSVKTFLTMNSHYARLNPFEKTPGGERGNDQGPSSKIGKNFEFSYTNPVSKRFGFSLNASTSDIFGANSIATRGFDTQGVGANGKTSSSANPYLTSIQWNNYWSDESRYAAGINLDFRLAPKDTLSASFSSGYYTSNYHQHVFRIRTRATGTGAPLDWGPNFTRGAPGVGDIFFQHVPNQASHRNDNYRVVYRHRGEDWDFDAVAGLTRSKLWYRNLSEGFFRLVSGTLGGLTINTVGFDSEHPGTVTATDAAGKSVDIYNSLNQMPVTIGANLNQNYDNTVRNYSLNLSAKRRFHLKSIYGSIKLGNDLSDTARRFDTATRNIAYLGPDGRANSGDETFGRASADLVHYAFFDFVSPYGNPKPTIGSSTKLYSLFQAHPEQFFEDLVASESTDLRTPNFVKNRNFAPYFMVDARLLKNRLRVVAGVRYENERIDGQATLIDPSAQYRKDASGTLLRDAAGNLVPIYSGTLTIEQRIARDRLIAKKYGAQFHRAEGEYFPSFNTSFNVTDNIVARFGYAKVIGRPNYRFLVGNTSVTELETAPSGTVYLNNAPGLIQTVNPALKPWKADAFDFRLEYYTKDGGEFSAGVYRRQVRGFFASRSFNADAAFLGSVGLSNDYLDYEVRSNYNLLQSVQISGFEANVNQSLATLGEFGRPFRVFASVTTVRTIGPNDADFRGFTPLIVNSGVAFNHKRLSLMVKQNLLGAKRTTAGPVNATNYAKVAELNGKQGYWFYKTARLTFDVSADYRFSKRFSVFAAGRNIFNERTVTQAYTDGNPNYVKDNNIEEGGVTFQIGLKGVY